MTLLDLYKVCTDIQIIRIYINDDAYASNKPIGVYRIDGICEERYDTWILHILPGYSKELDEYVLDVVIDISTW